MVQIICPITNKTCSVTGCFFGGSTIHCSLKPDHPTTTSGSVAAPKEEPNIDDNLATYTHFDMLTMVARQTKHMFEENEQLREALKELMPIVERKFNGISIDDAASHREYIALKAIIERARKTLNQ